MHINTRSKFKFLNNHLWRKNSSWMSYFCWKNMTFTKFQGRKPFNPISTGGEGEGVFHHAVRFLLISPKLSARQGRFFLTFNIYLLDTFWQNIRKFSCLLFNHAQSVERCQSFQAKFLTKKHNLTFDIVMVLTSNLVHILIMSKDICWHKHFMMTSSKLLTRQKLKD